MCDPLIQPDPRCVTVHEHNTGDKFAWRPAASSSVIYLLFQYEPLHTPLHYNLSSICSSYSPPEGTNQAAKRLLLSPPPQKKQDQRRLVFTAGADARPSTHTHTLRSTKPLRKQTYALHPRRAAAARLRTRHLGVEWRSNNQSRRWSLPTSGGNVRAPLLVRGSTFFVPALRQLAKVA